MFDYLLSDDIKIGISSGHIVELILLLLFFLRQFLVLKLLLGVIATFTKNDDPVSKVKNEFVLFISNTFVDVGLKEIGLLCLPMPFSKPCTPETFLLILTRDDRYKQSQASLISSDEKIIFKTNLLYNANHGVLGFWGFVIFDINLR